MRYVAEIFIAALSTAIGLFIYGKWFRKAE